MHSIYHLLPCFDLLLTIDARHLGVAGSSWGGEGRFGDEKGAWGRGARSVVFGCEVIVDVGGGGAVAGKGCHCYALGEGEVSNMDGVEEGWCHCFVIGRSSGRSQEGWKRIWWEVEGGMKPLTRLWD